MFTTPCFIRKNTKELRDKIYRLGGRSGIHLWDNESSTLIAVDADYFRCWDDEWGNADNLIKKGYIDCGTNEPLLLALCSLRNDSDMKQYFIADTELKISFSDMIGNDHYFTMHKDEVFIWDKNFENANIYDGKYHKMSVEELIEYFKE